MKLNNKAQTIVIFVLILPVILLGIAFIINKCMLTYEYEQLNNINKEIVENINKGDFNYDDTYFYINQNIKNVSITKYEVTEEHINIILTKEIDNLFTMILGQEKQKIVSEVDINR